MTEQMKRITRKVCEEIGIQHGLKHPDAVMTNPKLRRLAHEMIDERLKAENEPKWVPRMSDEELVEVIEPDGEDIDVPALKEEWEKAHTGPGPEGDSNVLDPGNGGPTEIEMELELDPKEEKLKEPKYPGEGEEKTPGS